MDGLDLEFPTLDLDLDETPVDNAVVDETQPETEVLDTPEGESTTDTPDGQEEEQPTDGRKVPDEVRKALKAFRDASPENAKAAAALRDSYGRELAYKAVWPTVKDAQAAQTTIQTIESFGGLEGVQNTIAEIEEIDAMLASGDARAVDKILEVAGEGAGKIVPAMLERFQASNPDAYAAAIRPHLVDAIGKSGLGDAVGAVMQALSIANTPGATAEFKAKWEKDATEGIAKIQQYLQGLGKTPAAPAAPAAGSPDKLSEREQQLTQREAQAFNNEVGALANTKMNSSLQKAVAPYVKGLGAEQRADYVQGVYDEITKLVKADKVYQTQKDALFKSKTKDAGKIAQLMNAKFDSVVGQAAKIVRDRRYGKAAPATPGKGASAVATVPGGVGSVEKPILVKELPARNDVNWDKTTDDMMMRGIRVLKSGKVVRLDR